jgi:hypothetical protein
MMYLTPQYKPNLPAHYGQLMTPAGGAKTPVLEKFAVDNGVFSGRFDAERFVKWLDKLKPSQHRCLFVVAPDVVGDHAATLARYTEWYPRLRAGGWPVAFAAQDGSESDPLPECQAVFIGGSTEWKLSPAALSVIHRARAVGVWVHVGRVNTQRRIRHFQLAGVDSVDGTCVAFEPDTAYRLIDAQLSQYPLWRNL